MIVAVFVREPPALAEGPDQATQAKTTTLTATQKAKQHYLKGEAYFKAHAFSAAMGEYLSGYEEKPDPVFIFNVAQCQRLLGHPEPALNTYRRYLVEAPEGAGRAIAERQVAELERLVAGGGTLHPSAVTEAFGRAAGSTQVAAAAPPAPPASGTAATVPAAPAPPEQALPLVPVRSAAPASMAPPLAFTTTFARTSSNPSTSTRASALLVVHTDAGSRPVYERWWFWAAASTVSVFAVVAIASSGGRPGCDAGRSCR